MTKSHNIPLITLYYPVSHIVEREVCTTLSGMQTVLPRQVPWGHLASYAGKLINWPNIQHISPVDDLYWRQSNKSQQKVPYVDFWKMWDFCIFYKTIKPAFQSYHICKNWKEKKKIVSFLIIFFTFYKLFCQNKPGRYKVPFVVMHHIL